MARKMTRSPRRRTKLTIASGVVDEVRLWEPSPVDESKIAGPQMKITYCVRREMGAERYTSTAYVNEFAPHYGTNKHTEEPLEVFWWLVIGAWTEKGIGDALPVCYCTACRGA